MKRKRVETQGIKPPDREAATEWCSGWGAIRTESTKPMSGSPLPRRWGCGVRRPVGGQAVSDGSREMNQPIINPYRVLASDQSVPGVGWHSVITSSVMMWRHSGPSSPGATRP